MKSIPFVKGFSIGVKGDRFTGKFSVLSFNAEFRKENETGWEITDKNMMSN